MSWRASNVSIIGEHARSSLERRGNFPAQMKRDNFDLLIPVEQDAPNRRTWHGKRTGNRRSISGAPSRWRTSAREEQDAGDDADGSTGAVAKRRAASRLPGHDG